MDSPELVAALAVSVSLRLLVIYFGLALGCLLIRQTVAERKLVPVALVGVAVATVPRILGIAFSLAPDRWMAYLSLVLVFVTVWPLLARWSGLGWRRGLYVTLVAEGLLGVFSLALL